MPDAGSTPAASTTRKIQARRRFDNLVALVGTVTRCDCRRKGYLAKVGVEGEPRMKTLRYFATWEHPEKDDPNGSTELCEYVWP